jgi:hypothetical protein
MPPQLTNNVPFARTPHTILNVSQATTGGIMTKHTLRGAILIILVLLGLLLGFMPTRAQESPIELAKAKEAFGHARTLSEADGARLWGVPLYGPMLLVDPETRFVVANQQDREGHLTETEGMFVGQLPESESIANTGYRWAGVTWTMLMWPLPTNRYARGLLMMHENFHRIQEDLGLPGSNPPNSHLDSQDGRTWLRLEWRALAEALIHRGAPRRSAISDALLFRKYRHSLFPQGAEQERALELNEGLAEYTGYRLSGWPDAILADRAAIRLEQDEEGTNFVRSFAYASGPAWAILLDEVPVAWRPELDRESDLATILADALGIAVPANLEVEARGRAAVYDGAVVMAREAARVEVQRQVIARHRARFLDGPVLILPLGESLRYTFSPQGAEALGDVGTVYLASRVTDEWGVLQVTNGVLLSRDQGGRVSEARVPAPRTPDGSTLEGDGWTLALAESWKLVPAARIGDFTLVKER